MLVRVEHALAPDLCGNSVLLLHNTDKSRHGELGKVVKQGSRGRESGTGKQGQEGRLYYSFNDAQDTMKYIKYFENSYTNLNVYVLATSIHVCKRDVCYHVN